ncbi:MULTISPECIES: hypothetical protein [Paenibacillus]|uniref:hypothetical protein n=1 Tax=Paenibacillus TaxID=44249 RepID=UPI000403151C|nr:MULTISPECIES: hypothetical protein [Paenibacillus]KGP85473.1 hypothetical protein P364_0100165 [Paenibacillus sp. MAEPY2]KGP87308.1 hypothetical protein P363_0113535 [Paenibacillus sp. MAEPY1]OZQ69960.1 hypothetical protein CA599_13125 [Paenibacillus taichungensis]HBU84333.1 hypothetical protein [Paenibacillus sp.]
MRNSKFTPYLSFIGCGLIIMTLAINLIFKYGRGLDEGSLMLLSVANAVSLFFTLVWGLFGIIELYLLLKSNKKLKSRLHNGRISKEEFMKLAKNHKFSFVVNISYLAMLLIQLAYVIMNWDEVNV